MHSTIASLAAEPEIMLPPVIPTQPVVYTSVETYFDELVQARHPKFHQARMPHAIEARISHIGYHAAAIDHGQSHFGLVRTKTDSGPENVFWLIIGLQRSQAFS